MKRPLLGVWYKATESDTANACVEVMHTLGSTHVRDTKDVGAGPVLSFAPEAWEDFLDSRIWER
ncbi:DUF397 domain-containing protein [Nocardia sp. SYP-A9097]|uniref:DUF397 domain-containing protein n=1 Tax=Nocardia sp. SYP-A9097 TaxID=2663237 RepID=UPI0013267DEE|nr:DUF397 domain-containing protein [Nocardia sp. SYP-A9097]MRH91574.1 DUF397 domain-containing protein [Nocardia sp. SYP-A9097]